MKEEKMKEIQLFLMNNISLYRKEEYVENLYNFTLNEMSLSQLNNFYLKCCDMNDHYCLLTNNIDNLIYMIKHNFDNEIINFSVECMKKGVRYYLIQSSINLIKKNNKYFKDLQINVDYENSISNYYFKFLKKIFLNLDLNLKNELNKIEFFKNIRYSIAALYFYILELKDYNNEQAVILAKKIVDNNLKIKDIIKSENLDTYLKLINVKNPIKDYTFTKFTFLN